MYDVLLFVGLFAGWIVLNLWVLPMFGIQTCMSGACRMPRVEHAEPRNTTRNGVNRNQTIREGQRP